MKEISASEKGRKERDEKIIQLYHKLNGKFALKLELYMAIGARARCGYNTVITTLQNAGIIEPRKAKAE